MTNIIREKSYRCYEDCLMSGCPSHRATLTFNSVVNHYKFELKDKIIYLAESELQTMIDLIKVLNRVDCVQIK